MAKDRLRAHFSASQANKKYPNCILNAGILTHTTDNVNQSPLSLVTDCCVVNTSCDHVGAANVHVPYLIRVNSSLLTQNGSSDVGERP